MSGSFDRVAILGAGGMGTALAVLLARSGRDDEGGPPSGSGCGRWLDEPASFPDQKAVGVSRAIQDTLIE